MSSLWKKPYAAINYDTIILLLGMMIVVANLRLSGFFDVVSRGLTAARMLN